MSQNYKIFEARLGDGERLPLLVNKDGSLMALPAIYVTMICRPRDASSTIAIKLNAIMIFYEWCKKFNVNVESRIKDGELINQREIDSLVHFCRLKLTTSSEKENKQTRNINKIRGQNIVEYSTQRKRLMFIVGYLEWVIYEVMKNVSKTSIQHSRIVNEMDRTIGILRKRIPTRYNASKNQITPPRGFGREIYQRIQDVIEPDHPENPWVNEFVRVRNQLYITICLALGPRIGESLNIKIGDIVRSDRPRINIQRRPDDPAEKRSRAPQVKTLGRPLRIGQSWFPLLILYLEKYRRRIRGARKHEYLFVSRKGLPLSYPSACKIFVTLREKVKGLPCDLTQHLIRHAWNERFSESGEAGNIPAEVMSEARRQIMGWSVSSKMPDLYDKRFTIRKTEEVSLAMQNEFFQSKKVKYGKQVKTNS